MDGLTQDTIGTTSDGKPVDRFTLTSRDGATLRVIALGATATGLTVPDRNGDVGDVLLGFDTVAEYETNVPYFGCTVGRVANRISNARFHLQGADYELAANLPPHHLHGGIQGFHKALWDAEPASRDTGPAVRFNYVSADGEEGYPGELTTQVLYQLTHDCALRIEYEAITTRATPVNLTNHAYLNLDGHNGGPILSNLLTIHADSYTLPAEDGIPTGEIAPVEGTPLDFRNATAVGDRIDQLAGGYDHNFVLDRAEDRAVEPLPAAEVYCPNSGRLMTLLTTEPGVQLYTGNLLGPLLGKGGIVYQNRGALCLETQHFPDSVNKPQFPSVILRPGEVYRQVTEYRFSTR